MLPTFLENYNEYIECVGRHIGAGACANVRREGLIYHLTDDTKLIHMLSVERESTTDEDDDATANGWLLLVITDIVS